jgi:hypothetical protein
MGLALAPEIDDTPEEMEQAAAYYASQQPDERPTLE